MAAAGKSGTEIGVALNRPRNSVGGRAWRLGIPLSGDVRPGGKVPRSPKAPSRPKLKRGMRMRVGLPTPPKPTNEVAFAPPPAANDEPASGGVELLALEKGMCKWPVGDKFCGCKAVSHKPYCMQHEYISKSHEPRRAAKSLSRAWR